MGPTTFLPPLVGAQLCLASCGPGVQHRHLGFPPLGPGARFQSSTKGRGGWAMKSSTWRARSKI